MEGWFVITYCIGILRTFIIDYFLSMMKIVVVNVRIIRYACVKEFFGYEIWWPVDWEYIFLTLLDLCILNLDARNWEMELFTEMELISSWMILLNEKIEIRDMRWARLIQIATSQIFKFVYTNLLLSRINLKFQGNNWNFPILVFDKERFLGNPES